MATMVSIPPPYEECIEKGTATSLWLPADLKVDSQSQHDHEVVIELRLQSVNMTESKLRQKLFGTAQMDRRVTAETIRVPMRREFRGASTHECELSSFVKILLDKYTSF